MNFQQLTVAHPYATALFKAANDAGVVDKVANFLAKIQQLVATDIVADVLLSPSVSQSNKSDCLVALLKSKDALQNRIVSLLVTNKRLGCVAEILYIYRKLDDQAQSRIRVEVRIPTELQNKTKNKIEAAIKSVLNCKQFLVDYVVDKSVIGGFEAVVEDKVIYASLRHMFGSLEV